jgi:hypothetical protein
MRAELVTGHWRFDSFSFLGKLSQYLETYRCDGSAPGHLAIRFIPENDQDRARLLRINSTLFASSTFDGSECESVFFDITRTRPPKFHLIQDRPWSHEDLTNMVAYLVTTNVSLRLLDICERYARREYKFEYDDCAYMTGFFPVCFQWCPIMFAQGHCVQLTLQILSLALYNDARELRYQLKHIGCCAICPGGMCKICPSCCIHTPPYAAYSPEMAVRNLQSINILGSGRELLGEQCFRFSVNKIYR